MEQKYGYVEAVFFKNAAAGLKKIVKKVVPKEQLYFSDTISRIQGDVTDNVHFTLFYGLEESALSDPGLKKLVEKIKIKSLKLEKVVLLEGYQGLYKVLCAEVSDPGQSLREFSKQMLAFPHNPELGKREFKPHITLAYVQPDYRLQEEKALVDTSLRVKRIRLFI